MAPRKSSRVVKKPKKHDDDSDYAEEREGQGEWEPQDEEEVGEEEYEERAPSKKKSKKASTSASSKGSKGKGKGKKKSKLEVFNEMPLDVLIEIMKQTDPKTLLAMSRTCSIFRRVLHSEGALSAWKSARRNVGLGDLKRPDVTEWEFAQLLFDGKCVGCGKTRAQVWDFILFVRGCADCMRGKSLRRIMLDEKKYHKYAFKVVARSLWTPHFDSEPMEFFWVPSLARVTRQLDALKDKPEELKSFVLSRKNIQTQARADSNMITQWQQRQKMIETNKKEDKRSVRYEKIKEKLRLEGYDEADIKSHALAVHPDVANARELSDNVWKRIKPILTTLLDEERTRRLANEAAQRQRARAFALKFFYQQIESSLPPSSTIDLRTYFPPFANFLALPSVQPLYVPEGFVPSTEDLSNAKPKILEEIQQFSIDLQETVHSNLVSAYSSLDPQFDPNTLSMTSCLSAIKCPSGSWCSTFSTFPSILEHARLCCGETRVITQDALTTSPLQIKTIRQIIEAVNSNENLNENLKEEEKKKLSESTTITELYALGNTFECNTCEFKKGQNSAAIGVATWSNAYKTKELNWVKILNHVLMNHAAEGEQVSIKYTPTPPPPPADPSTLEKEEDDDDNATPQRDDSGGGVTA